MAGYIGTKAVNLSTTGADIAGDADVSGALDVGGAFTSQGIDDNATSTAMTLDGSGNLLVGHSGSIYNNINTTSTVGSSYSSNGEIFACSDQSSGVMFLNRKTTDGAIATFRKDGSTVGIVESFSSVTLGLTLRPSPSAGPAGLRGAQSCLIPFYEGADRDNQLDLGRTQTRWDDIHATNGTIQTSDRNDKQDIEVLSDAEQRVAVAAKGLMRKFRWRDAVEAKGDDARIHCGIIAQDLQAAFTAEGLDAGDYAMFISSTWWEHDVEVPAVEAVAEVLDEEGNVVTEAVEAADAYTRTDTYDTQEEAPEGATERTRLGVRYSELLAFIIGAL